MFGNPSLFVNLQYMFFFTKSIYWARVWNRCMLLPLLTAPFPRSHLILLAHPHPLCTLGGAVMALRLPLNPSPHPRPSICMHCPSLGCALCRCHIGDGVPPHLLLRWLDCRLALPFPLCATPLHMVLVHKWGRRTWDRAENGGVRGWGDSILLASLTQDEGGKAWWGA